MYLPWWAIILLGLVIAGMAYEAGAERVRAQWQQSEKERRERQRLRKEEKREAKEEKREAKARQRIRDQYGEDLDDEAIDMIGWISKDSFSQETKDFAISMELLEDYRRKKAREAGESASPEVDTVSDHRQVVAEGSPSRARQWGQRYARFVARLKGEK